MGPPCRGRPRSGSGQRVRPHLPWLYDGDEGQRPWNALSCLTIPIIFCWSQKSDVSAFFSIANKKMIKLAALNVCVFMSLMLSYQKAVLADLWLQTSLHTEWLLDFSENGKNVQLHLAWTCLFLTLFVSCNLAVMTWALMISWILNWTFQCCQNPVVPQHLLIYTIFQRR